DPPRRRERPTSSRGSSHVFLTAGRASGSFRTLDHGRSGGSRPQALAKGKRDVRRGFRAALVGLAAVTGSIMPGVSGTAAAAPTRSTALPTVLRACPAPAR